jgi:ADP-L-glycero-D-manno-heptose 6-epimerase
MPITVITGALGLIGSNVVRHLNGLGETDLVLVDRIDHPSKASRLQQLKFLELVPIDQLFSWMQGRASEIGAWIHLGACSDTWETNREFLRENNTLYTLRLAEFALLHGHRFIYASSAATYGRGENGFSDDHALLGQLKPMNPYGESKHEVDLWMKQQGVLDSVVGLKYFNIFGPGEEHKGHMASMVWKMLPVAAAGEPIRLYKSTDPGKFADGEQKRDFLYVNDAARMTCRFLAVPDGGIYNIAMGRGTTWNELAGAIFTAFGQTAKIEYIDMPGHLVPNYQNYTCADMAKYAALDPAPPSYPIEAAVRDYVQTFYPLGRLLARAL